MSAEEKKTLYRKICEKLGFEPYKMPKSDISSENDKEENPFTKLDLSELVFLSDNGLFVKGLD
jgi:hypothetical protein